MRGFIIGDSTGKNLAFPCDCRELESLELANNFEHAMLAAGLRSESDMLPMQQPTHKCRGSNGLNLLAQRTEGEPMDARQQAAFAPFGDVRICEFVFAAQDCAACL